MFHSETNPKSNIDVDLLGIIMNNKNDSSLGRFWMHHLVSARCKPLRLSIKSFRWFDSEIWSYLEKQKRRMYDCIFNNIILFEQKRFDRLSKAIRSKPETNGSVMNSFRGSFLKIRNKFILIPQKRYYKVIF